MAAILPQRPSLWTVARVHDDLAQIKQLLAAGVDPDEDDNGFTALYSALSARGDNFLPIMQALLEAGADPNYWQGGREYELSALFLAVGEGHLEAAELLLRYGADPNWARGGVLHVCAIRASVATIRLLDQYGANWNVRDEEGKLPFDTHKEVLAHIASKSYNRHVEHLVHQMIGCGEPPFDFGAV